MPENQSAAAFICHSHEDAAYLKQLLEHLALAKQQGLAIWSSQDIPSGARWQLAIETALANTTVGILLVSASFLASPFIRQQELPVLLRKAEEGKLRLLSLIWRECGWRDSLLAKYQPLNSQPLASLPKPRREATLAQIAAQITEALRPTAGAERGEA